MSSLSEKMKQGRQRGLRAVIKGPPTTAERFSHFSPEAILKALVSVGVADEKLASIALYDKTDWANSLAKLCDVYILDRYTLGNALRLLENTEPSPSPNVFTTTINGKEITFSIQKV